ncbi:MULTISPECIES: hypothetical protein [unclassified Halomonas]|uniref:hypothetical protein n=1 Tax=unclassified Halomonas TaxID=2609666 RepID=UPI000D357106|nr:MULTISPECIES: hypothetical protein [unclassified Halomonas]MCJ8283873.1 hypothetical protein [Halomonas sp.]NQY68926.1 hypothetical protein [Halomonas sp.]
MSRSSSSSAKLMLWLSICLFAAFFINVAIQRYVPGMWALEAAYEAVLLTLATAFFVSACLKFEGKAPSGAEPGTPTTQQGQ